MLSYFRSYVINLTKGRHIWADLPVKPVTNGKNFRPFRPLKNNKERPGLLAREAAKFGLSSEIYVLTTKIASLIDSTALAFGWSVVCLDSTALASVRVLY